MSQKISDKISQKFFDMLAQSSKEQELANILNELLTKTERIMLAKRLAIILLLEKNTPQHKIVETLKVSYTTVSKMSLEVEKGKYKNILKVSKRDKVDLEKIVWEILTVGGWAPPIVGRKRWSKLEKNQ